MSTGVCANGGLALKLVAEAELKNESVRPSPAGYAALTTPTVDVLMKHGVPGGASMNTSTLIVCPPPSSSPSYGVALACTRFTSVAVRLPPASDPEHVVRRPTVFTSPTG